MKWLKQNHPLITSFLILCLLGSVALLNQEPRECRNGDKSRQKCYQAVDDYTPHVTFRDQILTHEPVANPKPKRDEWRSERDLIAQSDMAKWAFWMLIVSGIMTVLSAIGIGLVLWTLRETMKAGEKLSEQNEIALTTSELELQPYLKASGITLYEEHVDKFPVYKDAHCIFHGVLTITNEGKTPVWIKSVISETSVQVSLASVGKVKNRIGTSPRDVYIGPNSNEDVPISMGFQMEGNNLPDFIKVNDIYYSLWTTIEYDDIFSLKTEHRKEMWVDHGIKFESIEVTNDTGGTETRLFLKMLKFGVGLRKKDVHPSKR